LAPTAGVKADALLWSRDSKTAVTIDRPPHQIVIKWLDEDESAPSKVSGGGSALIEATPVKGDEPFRE
jgi:hypothetical protein